jgi:NTP pyrophosphatase (non-canonical NTP hydrolase)
MNIPEIIKEHHQAMVDKGFYDKCPLCEGFFKASQECCSECNGSGIKKNKNIGELLMLIVSELGEALEAHRNNRFSDWDRFERIGENRIKYFESDIKDTFEDEIADVFLRIFDLCGYLKIEPVLPSLITTDNTTNIAEKLFFITIALSETNYIGVSILSNISDSIQLLQNLCDDLQIPIEKHILAKMAYNKTRPHKHGKEY